MYLSNKIIFNLLLFAKQHNLYYEICFRPDESSDDILETNSLSQNNDLDYVGKRVFSIFF